MSKYRGRKKRAFFRNRGRGAPPQSHNGTLPLDLLMHLLRRFAR